MSLRDKWLNMTANLSDASPKIKIVVGVIGLIGAGVYACVKSAKAKVKEATEEERKIFDDIHRVRESQNGELPEEEKIPDDITACYSKQDYAKDVIKTSLSYVKKVLKVYAIPLLIGFASTCLIFNGMHVMNNRNLAISAAYAMLSSSFEEYRERVKERIGEEAESELYYATEHKDVKDTAYDKTVENAEVAKIGKSYMSPYLVIFDQSCDEWVPDLAYCQHTLNGIESILQHELDKKKAFISFGDLLDRIGKKIDKDDKVSQLMAMCCGWRHGDKIDLRVHKIYIPTKDGEGAVPFFTIDPNVRDIHVEIVSEYSGDETGTL